MRKQFAVSIVRHDDPACPAGAREIMGPDNRIGCTAKPCAYTNRYTGGRPRALWYAREETTIEGEKKPAIRVIYLCAGCASAFALQHRLELEVAL